MINYNFGQPQQNFGGFGQMQQPTMNLNQPYGGLASQGFSQPTDWGSMNTWFGSQNNLGILPTIGNLAVSGIQAYTGLRQLDLSKRQMAAAESAAAFNKQMHIRDFNRNLEMEARRRYSANSQVHERPDDYVRRHRIGG